MIFYGVAAQQHGGYEAPNEEAAANFARAALMRAQRVAQAVAFEDSRGPIRLLIETISGIAIVAGVFIATAYLNNGTLNR